MKRPAPLPNHPSKKRCAKRIQFDGFSEQHLKDEVLFLNVHYKPNLPGLPHDIFQQLDQSLEFASHEIVVWGKKRQIPRLQCAYGDPGITYSFSQTRVPSKPWVPILLTIKQEVEKLVNCKFNFVLANKYLDGKHSIGEHKDDEAELEEAPIVGVSFGQARDFVLRHEMNVKKKYKEKYEGIKNADNYAITLQHCSAIILNPPTNSKWYHSVPSRSVRTVSGPRISLTFRKMKTDIPVKKKKKKKKKRKQNLMQHGSVQGQNASTPLQEPNQRLIHDQNTHPPFPTNHQSSQQYPYHNPPNTFHQQSIPSQQYHCRNGTTNPHYNSFHSKPQPPTTGSSLQQYPYQTAATNPPHSSTPFHSDRFNQRLQINQPLLQQYQNYSNNLHHPSALLPSNESNRQPPNNQQRVYYPQPSNDSTTQMMPQNPISFQRQMPIQGAMQVQQFSAYPYTSSIPQHAPMQYHGGQVLRR